jgi:hypothetical protein
MPGGLRATGGLKASARTPMHWDNPLRSGVVMSTLTLYWLAALAIAFFMTLGVVQARKRLERTAMIAIKVERDANPRRRQR